MKIPKKVDERVVHENPWRNILEKDFLEKNNKIYSYITIVAKGTKEATMILPITTDGQIVMQKEYRVGIEGIVYQFPIGILEENLGEIENCEKELVEETGYKSKNIVKIGRTILEYYYDAHVSYFIATDCDAGIAKPEIQENIETLIVSKETFIKMIQDNTINCPFTLACYTLAVSKGLI